MSGADSGPRIPPVSVLVPCSVNITGLRALLGSLAAQDQAHEVVVIDNGTEDAAASALARGAGAEVIRFDRNRGYTVAINAAARAAGGDVLVLVNDDEVLEPEFVGALAAGVDTAAGIAMAAGVMREARDESLIDSAGMELDSTLLVFDYLNGYPLSALGPAPDPIGPSGAAAAFDRALFLEHGGFDEAVFAYWEDVDLVLRLRLDGASCVLARDAIGTHRHSATLGPGSAAKDRLTGYGRGYMLRKWGVMRGPRALSVLARELPIVAGQFVVDRNFAGARGRIRGWRDAGAIDPRPYPAAALRGHGASGLTATLARRWRRRGRLRRGGV